MSTYRRQALRRWGIQILLVRCSTGHCRQQVRHRTRSSQPYYHWTGSRFSISVANSSMTTCVVLFIAQLYRSIYRSQWLSDARETGATDIAKVGLRIKTIPGNSAAQGRIRGPVVLRPSLSTGLPLGLRRKCQAMFGAKARSQSSTRCVFQRTLSESCEVRSQS